MWDLGLITSAFLKPFTISVYQKLFFVLNLCRILLRDVTDDKSKLCSSSCGGIMIPFVPFHKTEKLMPEFMFYCFLSKSFNFIKNYLKLEIFADLLQSGVSVSNCISNETKAVIYNITENTRCCGKLGDIISTAPPQSRTVRQMNKTHFWFATQRQQLLCSTLL